MWGTGRSRQVNLLAAGVILLAGCGAAGQSTHDPGVVWRHPLGNEHLAYVPLVTPDTVFIVTAATPWPWPSAPDHETLTALSAANGSKRWSSDLPGSVGSVTPPVVAHGVVLVGSGSDQDPRRGYYQAYSAVDGKLLWRVQTAPNTANGFEMEAVTTSAVLLEDFRSDNQQSLTAVDLTTGHQLWALPHSGPPNRAVQPFGFAHSSVGQIIDDAHLPTNATLVVSDAIGMLSLYDVATGRLIRQVPASGEYVAVATNTILVTTSPTTHQAHGYDMATLRPLWSISDDPNSRWTTDGRILFRSQFESAQRIDPATGRTLWSIPFPGLFGVVIINDRLLLAVGQTKDSIRHGGVIDAVTGAIRWTRSGARPLFGFSSNAVFLQIHPCDQGLCPGRAFQAIDPTTGKTRWTSPLGLKPTTAVYPDMGVSDNLLVDETDNAITAWSTP